MRNPVVKGVVVGVLVGGAAYVFGLKPGTSIAVGSIVAVAVGVAAAA